MLSSTQLYFSLCSVDSETPSALQPVFLQWRSLKKEKKKEEMRKKKRHRQTGMEQSVCSIGALIRREPPAAVAHSLLNAHTHKNVGVYCHCVARRPPTQWQMELWFHACTYTHTHSHTPHICTYICSHSDLRKSNTQLVQQTLPESSGHRHTQHTQCTQHTLT